MKTIRDLLAEQGFFADMGAEHLDTIAGCGHNATYSDGEHLFREGRPADTFHLVRHGRVAVEILVPGRGPLVVDTRDEGEVVGWSWLFPPYRWRLDARAVGVVRTVAIDGHCLREKAEADHDLGYALIRRITAVIIGELEATRLQLVDLYGHEHARP